MIFGEFFFKRKIRKLIENHTSRKHRFCSLEDAADILVLYRHEDTMAVEPKLKELKAMKKNVISCVSCSSKSVEESTPFVIHINEAKEADKYGIPNSELSAKVAKIKADILIDLSRGNCHILKVLMLQHPSTFKVGERAKEDSLYDFSLIMTEGAETAELFENLLFYLRTIRSK